MDIWVGKSGAKTYVGVFSPYRYSRANMDSRVVGHGGAGHAFPFAKEVKLHGQLTDCHCAVRAVPGGRQGCDVADCVCFPGLL